MTGGVNGRRYQLLACPALPLNENGRIAQGCRPDRGENLHHDIALSDHVFELVLFPKPPGRPLTVTIWLARKPRPGEPKAALARWTVRAAQTSA